MEVCVQYKSELIKGQRIREFFEAEAQALYNRYLVIQTLLPSEHGRGSAHRAEEGRHIESILRDFLNRHLPLEVRAFSGFIVRPSTKLGQKNYRRVRREEDRHSSQIDIIVYNIGRFPLYEQFEEFVVVPPEGVIAMISVKKTLRVDAMGHELSSLERACLLCEEPHRRAPYLGLFAFGADGVSTDKLGSSIFRQIKLQSSGKPYHTIVTEISVFDRLVAFKFRKEDSPKGTAKFVRVDAIDNITRKLALNIPLQRMLQSILGVYYDPSRGPTVTRPGFVSFYKGQFNKAPVLGLVKTARERIL
jgi:hypothetical protein